MSVQIAVLDPLPMFRRGIMEMLGEASYEPKTPRDLLTWLQEEPRRVVLLTLQSAEDWALLAQLRERSPEAMLVAVLDDIATPNYVRAIVSGAAAVMPRDASPEFVRRVFEEAMGGKCLLPVEVVKALTSPANWHVEDDPTRPSPREAQWLRGLARGTTVAKVAEDAGYSERAMFRLLRELYQRMGVRN
jgi:DNA-binding NarL/FixJ family response regulator